MVEASLMEEPGARAMERLLDLPRPPTAVFAVNDMATVGAHAAVLRRGLHIPEDVSLVGYNDVPLVARLDPPLTTVYVPAAEFGRAAAEILFEQLDSGASSRRRIVFEPWLVVRGSTAPPRAGAG